MLSDIYAYEEPRWSVRLERESEDHETEQSTAKEMLVAVDAFAAGWLEPLALHLSIGCYDTETFHAPIDREPPAPQWFLRKAMLPTGVEPTHVYADPAIDTVPELTFQEIQTWVVHAMDQECLEPPRFIPSWRELYWQAVRVKLPDPSSFAERDILRVNCYAGAVSVPVERAATAAWISGPLDKYGFGPPVRLLAHNYDGVITIGIDVYWNLWIDASAGRTQVEAAVHHALALGRGWRRSEG
jgi:hypothetical protein